MTVTTFYSGTGDGRVRNSNATYATCQSAATGDVATDNDTQAPVGNGKFGATYFINRGFVPFDTSTLPDTDAISAANLGLYRYADEADVDSDSISIVQSSQASNTALATADFDAIGTTKGATDKTFAAWIANGAAYNVFALNATGQGWISKTGYTLIGARTAKDIAATQPAGNGYISFVCAETTGTTTDPYLQVTHAPTVYTLTAAQGSFTLTNQTVVPHFVRMLVMAVGQFVLTGISAVLTAVGWENQTKNTSTWNNENPTASTWTNQDKS